MILRIVSGVARCKLKSPVKLKSKIANISSESKIAGFANISSCNKFLLYGIKSVVYKGWEVVGWLQLPKDTGSQADRLFSS